MTPLATTVAQLHLFGDPTRVRLMALLARHELTVAELTVITGLAQPRISTHLGTLREGGVLRDRKAGASTFYAVNEGSMPAAARKVWAFLEKETRDAILDGDLARCDEVLAARARRSTWPEPVAGRMENHYSPGRTWESLVHGLVGLLQLGDVLDVGAGDGSVAELLAPQAMSLTCLDSNGKMVQAARKRLASQHHVTVHEGDAEALPFDAQRFDVVLLLHVLTHAATPARVVAEAARVLRPGGTVALVTLDAHGHGDVTAAYHHRHAGFSPAALRRLLRQADLTVTTCAVTSRERRSPFFHVLTAFAAKPRRAKAARPTSAAAP